MIEDPRTAAERELDEWQADWQQTYNDLRGETQQIPRTYNPTIVSETTNYHKKENEMKTNDAFPSKYLKAEDDIFDDGEVIATIKDVAKETMRGGRNSNQAEQDKPVMYFRELPKGLVMNKTNWGICEKMFGSDESDDWIGNKVSLGVIETVAYGEAVKSIRISEKKPKVNKQELLDRYSKLFARAKEIGVENVESYAIAPDMDESEIMDLGRELKQKIAAAELFA